MVKDWNEGYFTQLPYTFGYYREMCPSFLRFCLLTRGFEPPPASAFAYCELGMGNGYSINVHAAANAGEFTGIDFMPEHVVFARDLARAAQSGLKALDESLAEFDRPGDNFDYICMHGLWSWVSEANRQRIVDILTRRLKPGGVCYLSYNCWPGWSAGFPLRALLTLFDAYYGTPGLDAGQRIENDFSLATAFLACEPLFLNASDWIAEQFNAMKKESIPYLAHEFFNRDWHVDWFKDVAERLFEARLEFGASARAAENIPGFGLTPDAARFLGEIRNINVREQLWDFLCNTRFRKDIFIKGSRRLDPAAARRALAEERIIAATPAEALDPVINCGMGSFGMDLEAHGRVMEILASHAYAAKSVAEIYEPLAARLKFPEFMGILARLVDKGNAQPANSEKVAIGRTRFCQNLNMAIFHDFDAKNGMLALASPVTGAGFTVTAEEMGFLASRLDNSHSTPPAPGSNPPEAAWTRFLDTRAPILRAHGILPLQDKQK